MKIIHYCLGLPPFATGGLTIYARDLANAQKIDNDVYMIYPGMNKDKLSLKKINNKYHINLYRLDGVLPCALTYGVKEPLDFIGNKPIEEVEKVFKDFENVDVLHLHTIQGLYPEIIEYFKNCGTKIIYTTHDFYPFSLTTKYYDDYLLNEKNNIIQSIKAPSTNALYLNRKPYVNNLKKFKFIKKIFNKHVKENKDLKYDEEYAKEYIVKSNKLYSFYDYMLSNVDLIHANSSLSAEIYKKHFTNVKTLNITHEGIKKNDIDKYKKCYLNIGFFGEQLKDKGFNLLLDLLDDIYKKNNSFKLLCYGYSNLYDKPYLDYMGPYKFKDLKEIHKTLDLVVFPAENIESFGFIVLESLAYKTPVIVSKNVGAKDFCNKDYIVNDRLELKDLLEKVINDKNYLNDYFNYDLKIDDFKNHNDLVIKELYK